MGIPNVIHNKYVKSLVCTVCSMLLMLRCSVLLRLIKKDIRRWISCKPLEIEPGSNIISDINVDGLCIINAKTPSCDADVTNAFSRTTMINATLYTDSYINIAIKFSTSPFLADRTNGRAIATVLRLSSSSSVCLWRYVSWLNGAS